MREDEYLWYHYYRLSNVMDVTINDRTLACSYDQDAFGNVLCDSQDAYHLTPKCLYPNIQLYYFYHRWYDPSTLGRFTQRDKIEEINRYIYCLNNPINLTDSTGEKIETVCYIGAMISCMFGFAPGSIAGSCLWISEWSCATWPCWVCLGLSTGFSLILCNNWAKKVCDKENKEPCDLPYIPELPLPPSPR